MGYLTDSKRAIKAGLRRPIQWFLSLRDRRTARKAGKLADRGFAVLHQQSRLVGNEVCYFASYDPDSIVDEYVFTLLNAWRSAGVSTVFVTTSKRLEPVDLERLRAVCHTVIHRKNLGYDMYSWKIGHRVVRPGPETSAVYLTNDSNYGPIRSWPNVLDSIRQDQADITGMTDSWGYSYHLQSSFLCFKNAALTSGFLSGWLSSIAVQPGKAKVVRTFEIGLTQQALRARLKVKAIYQYSDLYRKYNHDPAIPRADDHHRPNPTYQFWNELVRFEMAPFLKVAVLRDNPNGLVRPGDLAQLWEDCQIGYPIEQILNHQRRISRGNAV